VWIQFANRGVMPQYSFFQSQPARCIGRRSRLFFIQTQGDIECADL
jgi:hypothetical protein